MKVSGDSREVARAAILLSMTASREEEAALKEKLLAQEIHGVAADYGGEFVQSVMKIVERAVVAAKREHVIGETHHEEGAVAGAAREALAQIMQKAMGLSVGGKIGVARHEDHIVVAVFFGVGLLHLNEISVGLGHRVV